MSVYVVLLVRPEDLIPVVPENAVFHKPVALPPPSPFEPRTVQLDTFRAFQYSRAVPPGVTSDGTTCKRPDAVKVEPSRVAVNASNRIVAMPHDPSIGVCPSGHVHEGYCTLFSPFAHIMGEQ